MAEILLLSVAFCVAALLYGSVGHGGASAYLAIMGLAGMAPEEMRPTALVLNVIVAAIALSRYAGAREFSRRTFGWLAMTSVPGAFLGGTLSLPTSWYSIVLGVVLIIAAAAMLRRRHETFEPCAASPLQLSVSGASIGVVSGLTGIGGGVFLTPWLIHRRWASPRVAAGISAAFIVVNSLAGLAGRWTAVESLPPSMPFYAAAVAVGGFLGASLAVRRFSAAGLRVMLAGVLIIAAFKMLTVPFL